MIRDLLEAATANRVYTVRRGLATGLRCRGGLAFVPSRKPASAEERFFHELDLAGQVIYDVGAYHGMTTVFFASRAEQVIAFEPNPVNLARLEENVRVNALTNVIVRSVALGARVGSATLVFPQREIARGSLATSIQVYIHTTEERVGEIRVSVATLDNEVARGLPPPDFVKIDVEGLELDVLRGMSGILESAHPALFIELHGVARDGKQATAREVARLVWEAGYSIQHIESGLPLVSLEDVEATALGHYYCEASSSSTGVSLAKLGMSAMMLRMVT